jgi:hypothetical protein
LAPWVRPPRKGAAALSTLSAQELRRQIAQETSAATGQDVEDVDMAMMSPNQITAEPAEKPETQDEDDSEQSNESPMGD